MSPTRRPSRATTKKAPQKRSGHVPLADEFKVREASKLGIASFVLSLTPILMSIMMVLWVIADVGLSNDPARGSSAQANDFFANIGLISGAVCVILVALSFVLGLLSLFEKGKDRDFGLMGMGIGAFWIVIGLMSFFSAS